MRLGGVTEAADELGVSRQRIAELRERPEFPSPVAEIAAGPIWDLDELDIWLNSGCHRKPGRPARGSRQKTFGRRYALETDDPIGTGGFAEVFRAADLTSGSRGHGVVALKVLRQPGNDEALARFRRELRLLSALAHPNVIPVLDSADEDDEKLWYAMPLALGSLGDELDHYIDADEQIVDVMLQICAGLGYLHESGIFHRDLKPSNVLRTKSGGWAISDFNLAREAVRSTEALTSTLRSGFGTYQYAAPEQWRDAKNADAASDIFSMGKILHALVIGDNPAPGDDAPQGAFRPIIHRATRSMPAQRYRSVAEFASDLRGVAAAPGGRWESTDDVIERLVSRLREDTPQADALSELLQFAQGRDGDLLYAAKDGPLKSLSSTIPNLTTPAIRYMWRADPAGFRTFFQRYAEFVASDLISFALCDPIAKFCSRAVSATGDGEVLRAAVAALAELGMNHDRWNVRSTLGKLLQEIRTTEQAFAALHGLRDVRLAAAAWALDDFTVRTLHPTLRQGVGELLKASG